MNKKETVKSILALQRRSLALSGSLSFKGKPISDLSDVGVQQHLKILDVSSTEVTTLDTLLPQKQLEKITADSSLLEDYKGFSKFKRVKAFSARNTPLAERPNFRLACAVLFGRKLESVNGMKLTQDERQKASTYPPIAEYLIEAGWDIVDPVPSADEFRVLAGEYKLQISGCDAGFANEMSLSLLRAPKSVYAEEAKEEKADGSYGDDGWLVEALLKELCQIRLQVKNDENVKEQLVDVIGELASVATLLADFKSEIQGVEDEEGV